MRQDEFGNACPETLGEYRDAMLALVGNDQNPAVQFLDQKIAAEGRAATVLAPDSQMRGLLFRLAFDLDE